ncbi:MAG: nickel-dependent hydrogenase large subunit [Sphingomonadaceae bacterium]
MSRQTVVPFGPQHPVLPEPIQLKLTLEDEKIVSALPAFGYCHRGVEKAGEINDFPQNVFLVERICGICSFIHALCYCQGIEKIMGVEVPERAKFLRVIWGELHRLHSHLLYLGLLADAFGFESLFMQTWRYREKVMDILEKSCGSRVIISTCTIGGVRRDLSDQLLEEILDTLKEVQKGLDQVAGVIEKDYTIRKRCIGVGMLSKEQALAFGAVGPTLRGSGIAQDVRMTGYAAYGQLKFEPVVETGCDSYARSVVRLREAYQAMDLVRQAIEKMPAGDIAVKVRGNPNGEAVMRVEQPRGELIYYIKGNGTKNLERLRVRTPTYQNAATLVAMLPGMTLADVPVIALSIDPCFSCTER